MTAPFNISGAPVDCPEDLLTTVEQVLDALTLMFEDRHEEASLTVERCIGIVHLLDGLVETIGSARDLVSSERREAFEKGYKKGSELRLANEPEADIWRGALLGSGGQQVLELLTGLDPQMALRVRELLFGQAKEG